MGRWSDGAGLAVGAVCQLALLPALYFLIQRVTGDLDVSRPARELADSVDGAAFMVVALMVTLPRRWSRSSSTEVSCCGPPLGASERAGR